MIKVKMTSAENKHLTIIFTCCAEQFPFDLFFPQAVNNILMEISIICDNWNLQSSFS